MTSRLNRARALLSSRCRHWFGQHGLCVMTDASRHALTEDDILALPSGATLIFRHFGASDREVMARKLRNWTQGAGARLLIAADPVLAAQCGADGIHWPDGMWQSRPLSARRPQIIETVAMHRLSDLSHAALDVYDAAFFSPILRSRSPSARRRAGLSRLRWVCRHARLPVVALGGMTRNSVRDAHAAGAAGLCVVEAWFGCRSE